LNNLSYSWHVRTKENIARVRRDEAAAQVEEQKRQEKLELAESEARINFLRRQSGLPEKASHAQSASAHNEAESQAPLNLFEDYQSHVKTTNKELEKEKKEEQEKYEKQIGYLTYLGQDTNEALKVHSWYEVAPKREVVGDPNSEELHLKKKLAQDPLTLINSLLPPEKKEPKESKKRKRDTTPTIPPGSPARSSRSKPKKQKKEKHEKKHKKSKKHKSHKREAKKESLLDAERQKRENLSRLRRERLRREIAERQRSEALFAPKEPAGAPSVASTPAPTPRIKQKYNSQFNPELAKQNMV
ncbi:hypothetical protein KR074_003571, partial [Drosophila pseudoananassae]